MQTKQFYSEKEFSEITGACRVTLWKYRKQGLPHHRIGKKILYDLNDFKEWSNRKIEDVWQ